jgi:protein TonB
MDSYVPYAPPQTNYRRIGGFAFVVVLHILFFYALQSGLAKTLVDVLKNPFEARVIEELKPESEEPPPPPPKIAAPPPVFVPMPEFAVESTVTESTITNTTSTKPTAAPPPPKADVIIPPRNNPRRPNARPEYPTMSLRLGEEGVVLLMLTVNEDGRVTEAKVEKSSGFERLDEAAVKEALRSYRFLPGSVNGKSAVTRISLPVRFTIDK